MSSERVSRTARSHHLGAYREKYRFNGAGWLLIAVDFLALGVLWFRQSGPDRSDVLAVCAFLALAAVAAGGATRTNKAVHVFDEGFVLTGMWGQVKQVGRWHEVSVRIKREVPRRSGGPPLRTHGVAVAGTERFGFSARQIVGGGQALAEVLVAAGAVVEPPGPDPDPRRET